MIWNPPFNPTITTLLVLLAGGAIVASYFLARHRLRLNSAEAIAIMLLRGLAFLLVLYLLLQPAALPEPRKIETRRTFAVLLDASGSMTGPATGAADEADNRLDDARRLLREHRVFAQVTDQAKLAVYTFTDQVRPTAPGAIDAVEARGPRTDLATAIEHAVRLHETDDLAGLLLVTDGRQTAAGDPRETARRLGVPLFPVAVGAAPADRDDPARPPKDLGIESVSADPRIIVGRTAQVVASVTAEGYDARQVTVELVEGDAPLSASAVAVSPQQPRRQAMFTVKPTTVGAHRYAVRIPAEDDDTDPTNNRREFTVEVVDPVNRLLYIDRLRSERKFVRQVLDSQRNLRYTAVVQQAADRLLVQGNDPAMRQEAANLSPAQLRGLKAVMIGDLPAAALTDEQIANLAAWVDRGGALLLMAGPRSMGEGGFTDTAIAELLPISAAGEAGYVEDEFRVALTAEGAAHPAFQKVDAAWAAAAPLLSRFDVADVKPAAAVLLSTADGRDEPLVVTRQYGHGKVAIVLTDTTWRWQLGYDPAAGGFGRRSPHAVFWGQVIDWLLPDLEETDDAAGLVQMITDRLEYEVGDEVVVMTSVRARDGTAITDAAVTVEVATPDDRPIRRTADLEGGSVYAADFEAYAAGTYSIQVTARRDGRTLGTDEATVRATQPVVEFVRLEPDRGLLRDLAQLSGGRYMDAAMLRRLGATVRLAPREVLVQPSADADAEPAWNKWWLGLIFLALMTGEWQLRRKNRWV